MICHECDSPDCNWYGSQGSTHWYRCEVCGEYTVGPDPYCVSFDVDDEKESA